MLLISLLYWEWVSTYHKVNICDALASYLCIVYMLVLLIRFLLKNVEIKTIFIICIGTSFMYVIVILDQGHANYEPWFILCRFPKYEIFTLNYFLPNERSEILENRKHYLKTERKVCLISSKPKKIKMQKLILWSLNYYTNFGSIIEFFLVYFIRLLNLHCVDNEMDKIVQKKMFVKAWEDRLL